MPTENGRPDIIPETPTNVPASFVIDAARIQRVLDNTEEEKRFDKCSIYRVPSHLVERNEKVYKPKLVSIGPYHHGEAQLKPMEEHKQRALCRFLKRSNKTLVDFKETLKRFVGDWMESYEELDEEWREEDKFLKLMILDGCFVLEILRVNSFDNSLGYSPSDPIFGDRGRSTVTSNLVKEFLMLENQLPLKVFEQLLAVESRTTGDRGMYMESIISIVGEKLGPEGNPASKLHIVDLLRNKIAGTPSSMELPELESVGIMSATTYAKAGITFEKSHTNFLSDIKLDKNVLHLPVFALFGFTETFWFNVWAFECLHTGLNQDVSAYICLMSGLLRSAEDVQLLRSRHLLAESVPTFGENDEVVELFRALNENIDYWVSGDLFRVVDLLNDCYQRRTSTWKRRIRDWISSLHNTYFKSPWTVLSLIAAVLLLALTIWQTVFTTLTYYNPNSNTPPGPHGG